VSSPPAQNQGPSAETQSPPIENFLATVLVRLLPRSGLPPEMTLLRRGGLVTRPVLNQEHPLTLHVTSEFTALVTFPLVVALFLVTLLWFRREIIRTFCVSKNEEWSQNTSKQRYTKSLALFLNIFNGEPYYLHQSEPVVVFNLFVPRPIISTHSNATTPR